MKQRETFVTLNPTWAGVLPMLIAVLEDGSAEGKRIARGELLRMAQIADTYVAENTPAPQEGAAA